MKNCWPSVQSASNAHWLVATKTRQISLTPDSRLVLAQD